MPTAQDVPTPEHFLLEMKGDVAVITLNRPEKKNPLTFDSYAELRDFFRDLDRQDVIKAVVVTGAGGNFCSGGDVHDIIGPLVRMDMKDLLAFTRMTGDLVKAMIHCSKPIVAAIDGICVGAGAIIAMSSDMRFGTPEAKTAFLFTRVGLAGCDMGACAMLPRIIGQGRAAELLYTGRRIDGAAARDLGLVDRLVDGDRLGDEALDLATEIAGSAPLAVESIRATLRGDLADRIVAATAHEAAEQERLRGTADFAEGAAAMAERRPPRFTRS